MRNLIIIQNKIEFKNNFGDTIRGEYYIKNNEIHFKAKTAYELSVILKNKNEILKFI